MTNMQRDRWTMTIKELLIYEINTMSELELRKALDMRTIDAAIPSFPIE